jgi:hypothetical protein
MPKTDISVRELVNKVQRGELILPEMQRRYVWPSTRVRDLLDSLYRGYPSGTILVWETDEDVATRDLAVKATRTPSTSQKLLLLDGQQRITSLTAILSGEAVQVQNRRRPIEILFNLEHPDGPPVDTTEVAEDEFTVDIEDVEDEETAERDIQDELRKRTFVVASRALKNNPLWVPVSEIFSKDSSEILERVGITSLQDPRYKKYSQRIQQVKNIENYQYVMQRLTREMSYEEVTEIFVRVNSLGIKLRSSDLALAQITSRWKGFMQSIEAFAAEFKKEDEEYVLETGLPIRLLVAFATGQSKFKTVSKLSKKELEAGWEAAQRGLEYAINFLHAEGIDNLFHLSSPFLLVPIAVYWVKKEGQALTPEEHNKLLRWFYLAHMRGHYGMGSSESILDADLGVLMRGKGLDELIKQLNLHVKKFDVDSSDLYNKGIRSPFFSMLYFVLKKGGAADWWSGLKLSEAHTGSAHAIQYHHVFPKSLLRDANYDKKEINEIANMAFIGGRANRRISNKEPKIYFTKEVIPARGEEALVSQLIPTDESLWDIPRYQDFLAYRREAIAAAINAFIKKLE